MAGLRELNRLFESLPYQEQLSPLFFIGHGSPMNGIEENSFSTNWQKLGYKLTLPRAVLVISAHWLTNGTYVTAMEQPRMIHDFNGFPSELSQVQTVPCARESRTCRRIKRVSRFRFHWPGSRMRAVPWSMVRSPPYVP